MVCVGFYCESFYVVFFDEHIAYTKAAFPSNHSWVMICTYRATGHPKTTVSHARYVIEEEEEFIKHNNLSIYTILCANK